MSNRGFLLAAAACCVAFFAIGVIFFPYTGAQYDEVLFSSAIYPPIKIEYVSETPLGDVPLMVMTYLGAFKAWLYMPLLALFGPSHSLLRFPMLATAALSILVFFLLARRITGPWPALLATALLATDLNFMLTSLLDWGPVAIQHLLLTVTLYAAIRYGQEGQAKWLALAGFAAGLALWDKAVIIWLAAGLGTALLLIYPKDVWAALRRPKHIAWAALAFVLGAYPLIYYNIEEPLETFTSRVKTTSAEYPLKIAQLDKTLRGEGMLGYMVREKPAPQLPPLNLLERMSLWLADTTRQPRQSLQHALIAVSLLSLPLLWFTRYGRAATWVALGCFVSCYVMFSTSNAGGALHHLILLWPLPHLLVALALAAVMAGRWHRAAAGVVLLGVVSNVLVSNTMLADFIRNGATPMWSDATRRLIPLLGKRPGRRFVAAEWGILEQIRYFGQGRIAYYPGSDGWVQNLANPDLAASMEHVLNEPAALFIGHTDGNETVPGTNATLLKFAGARGFQKQVLETVPDHLGRPVYEVFEFRKP